VLWFGRNEEEYRQMIDAMKALLVKRGSGIGKLLHRKSFHRMIVFSPEAWERLEAVRAREQTGNRCEVVRDALRLYEFMSEASAAGPVCVVVDHGDNTRTSHEIFAKK